MNGKWVRKGSEDGVVVYVHGICPMAKIVGGIQMVFTGPSCLRMNLIFNRWASMFTPTKLVFPADPTV